MIFVICPFFGTQACPVTIGDLLARRWEVVANLCTEGLVSSSSELAFLHSLALSTAISLFSCNILRGVELRLDVTSGLMLLSSAVLCIGLHIGRHHQRPRCVKLVFPCCRSVDKGSANLDELGILVSISSSPLMRELYPPTQHPRCAGGWRRMPLHLPIRVCTSRASFDLGTSSSASIVSTLPCKESRRLKLWSRRYWGKRASRGPDLTLYENVDTSERCALVSLNVHSELHRTGQRWPR
jgi:hypothetical protein